MTRAPLTVAVGGFDGLDAPGPGPSVARALRAGWRGRLRIVATGADGLLAGAWQPGAADELRAVPDAAADPDGFADAVGRLRAELGIAAYLPGSTAEALALACHADTLTGEGLAVPPASADGVRRLTRRGQLEFLHAHDFAVPFSQHVRDLDEVRMAADQIGFPLVVLGMVGGGTVVHDAEEVEVAAHRLDDGDGVILRRAIAGDGFNVALVADREARIRGLVAIRRLLADPVGRPASGAVIDDDRVREAAERVHKALRWRGPLEIDLVRGGGSDRMFVTDIRPTLPAWSMLTEWAGCNLPVLALRALLGRGPATRRPRPGVLFIRGVAETPVAVDDFQRLRRGGGASPANGVNGAGRAHRGGTGGLRIAVTGTGSFDVVNPGLGAARALRQAPDVDTVIGFGYGNFESGLYQPDLFDACFRLPASGSPDTLFERIADAHGQQRFDVLIPSLDGELPRMLKIRRRLADLGVATLLPSKRALDARAKTALFAGRLPADWGAFRIPESRIVRSEAEAVRAAVALGLPCVVKGPLARCIPAHSAGEVRSAWARLRAEGTGSAIVQVLLEGEIFATAAICDRDHQTIARTTVKKVAICERGSTWSASHVPNPALEASFAAFLDHIGWVGPVEGEFIRDRVTDRYYLFEVNPRFTAWIAYTAALGSNHPYLTALAALGRHLPAAKDEHEVMFMRSSIEVPVRPSRFAAFSTRGALIHA